MFDTVTTKRYLSKSSGITYWDIALRIVTALNIDPATVVVYPMTANISSTDRSDDMITLRDVHDTAKLFREVDSGDPRR